MYRSKWAEHSDTKHLLRIKKKDTEISLSVVWDELTMVSPLVVASFDPSGWKLQPDSQSEWPTPVRTIWPICQHTLHDISQSVSFLQLLFHKKYFILMTCLFISNFLTLSYVWPQPLNVDLSYHVCPPASSQYYTMWCVSYPIFSHHSLSWITTKNISFLCLINLISLVILSHIM